MNKYNLKNFNLLSIIAVLFLIASCKRLKPDLEIPSPKNVAYAADTLKLSKEVYYDKLLGAFVGSAIGDAMGASTEMWARNDIRLKYGYILGLTPAVRGQSPEGTWKHNLMAGATTDDTRWKMLMVKYISKNKGQLNPSKFCKFITDYYASVVKTLSDPEALADTGILDDKIEKMEWIKEWARVSLAYQKSPEAYQLALNRFYGGEMSCAGQLYSPMFGLIAHTPEEAYNVAYDHALFDLGYAKDISGLVSAMTQMAMRTQNMDSILDIATFIDPYGYQDSRLVGRIPYSVADASIKQVLAIKDIVLVDSLIGQDSLMFRKPKGFNGSYHDWVRQEMVYQFLEENEMDIPFHAGEIWRILVTGLEYGEGDFIKTLQFIINNGRDNDTVGAIAGMIMGAKVGYAKLPKDLKEVCLKVNRDVLGIDLEALAQELLENATTQ